MPINSLYFSDVLVYLTMNCNTLNENKEKTTYIHIMQIICCTIKVLFCREN